MGGSGRDSVRVLSFSTTHSASAVRLQFKSCRRFELANDCDWSHNFWIQNQVQIEMDFGWFQVSQLIEMIKIGSKIGLPLFRVLMVLGVFGGTGFQDGTWRPQKLQNQQK